MVADLRMPCSSLRKSNDTVPGARTNFSIQNATWSSNEKLLMQLGALILMLIRFSPYSTMFLSTYSQYSSHQCSSQLGETVEMEPLMMRYPFETSFSSTHIGVDDSDKILAWNSSRNSTAHFRRMCTARTLCSKIN